LIDGNRKKYKKQKITEFKTLLKNKFSFIPEAYCRNIEAVYRMILGTRIGISSWTAIKIN
jgi:hypothetical protein